MNDALFSISGNHTGNSGIRCRRALFDHSSKAMSSLSLNHIIDIFSCFESRSQSDGKRCHFSGRSKIFLCKYRIDQCIRSEFFHRFPCLIDKNRNLACLPDFLTFTDVFDPSAGDSFHIRCSVKHSFAKRYFSANRTWFPAFQHQYMIPAFIKPVYHPTGQISSSTNDQGCFFSHFFYSAFSLFSCMTFSTALTIFWYPVQRQRFPDIFFLISSLVSSFPCSRRTVADITNPGVQNPH